jgi:hypothetical protein
LQSADFDKFNPFPSCCSCYCQLKRKISYAFVTFAEILLDLSSERIGVFGVMDFRLAAGIIELVLLGYDGVMVCSVDKRQQTLGRGRRVQFGYGSCAVYCTRCSFCTALLFHKMTHITSSRVLQSGNHQLVYTFSEFWTCCLRYVLVSNLLSGGEEELKEDRRNYWMQ